MEKLTSDMPGDDSVKWTIPEESFVSVPKVSVLERVDCNLTSYFILELHLRALVFHDSFNCLTECF